MSRSPSLVVAAVAAAGAVAFRFAPIALPPSRYAPAALGAAAAVLVTGALISELPRGPRLSISAVAGVLGFFVGTACSVFGVNPWSAGFGGAFLPALLLFLAGFGREQLALELARLENDVDDKIRRPHVLERVRKIRDGALAEAKRLDPSNEKSPENPGDPRAVYAYAAQIVAYGAALEGRFADAVASLGPVPPAWMPGSMRLLMLSNLAFWQLCTKDVEGARKTVDRGDEKDSLPEARPNFRATRAMVLACSGKADEALEIVGRTDADASVPERVRPRFGIVRAHALAASGDKEAARRELTSVLEGPVGVDELRRWLPAGGAAVELMEEVMRKGPAAEA